MMEPSRQAVSSTARDALHVVGLFSIERQTIGVNQIARELGLSKSKASRLINALLLEGFVAQMPDRRYRLGLRLLDLGGIAARSHAFYGPMLSALIRVHQATGESTHLAVLDGESVVHLERLRSDHLMELTSDTRYHSPVHATSTGKVLLAFAPPKTLDRVIANGLARLTPLTITDPERLRTELQRVRTDGYALCREEFVDGISSVSVPIFDRRGDALAAMSVVTKVNHLSAERVSSLVPLLQRTAARVRQDDAFAAEVTNAARERAPAFRSGH
jgi:IclR family transcriptional regulator, KDG regulon repressor